MSRLYDRRGRLLRPSVGNGLGSPKSGTVTADAEKLQVLVEENRKKLAGCAGGHRFTVEGQRDGSSFVRTWKCAKCGGEVPFDAKMWYELGRAHARPQDEAGSGTPANQNPHHD